MRTGMRITSSGVVGYRICISANIFSRRTGRRCGDRRGPGRRKTPRGGAYRGKRPGNGAGADKVPEGYPWDAQAQSASRERRGGYAQCGTGAGFQCRPAAADAILNLRWRGGRAVECGGLLIRCTGIMPVPRVRIPPSPPRITFRKIKVGSLGAKRLGMVFFRNFEGIFEIQNQSAVGNAEGRRAKLWQNGILQTNLFSFAFSERLSVFFFDCPKANYQKIWTI